MDNHHFFRRVGEIMFIAILIVGNACSQNDTDTQRDGNLTTTASGTEVIQETTSPEVAVTVIPLAGPLTSRNAEISGLAWYGDYLILLPQYPNRFDNSIFALPKQAVADFLKGTSTAVLNPQAIPIQTPGLTSIRGYEGFEAIAFVGDQVFLTIEASPRGDMKGYLVKGTIEPDLSQVVLQTETPTEIQPQSDLSNYSDETLIVGGESILTIYEANGQNVNPNPVTHLFDLAGQPQHTMSFPNIEYRITDATALDEEQRFWAINYLFPGNVGKLNPAPDLLRAKFGSGTSHQARENVVERLVEFQVTDTGIEFTDTPPIQLVLLPDEARNWEGVVRFDSPQGFLLATDKFPETILAFVPASK
ncbi:MAG: hypothetical protein AAF629_30940 [Chloroflexota bacterium]